MASKLTIHDRIKVFLMHDLMAARSDLLIAKRNRAKRLGDRAKDVANAEENLAYFNSLEVPDGK